MGKDSVPEIELQQMDAILKYLPIFEKPDFRFGQWIEPEGHLASVFESGHITAVLHHLKQIREKMP